jgi:iron complex transport system ATP-binding protein
VILHIAGLRFSYNSHPVIRDVGFTLKKGETLAVLGTNGAGKSTLLKCIDGILKPQRGTVLLGGVDTKQMEGRAVARRLGYVPQRHLEEEGLNTFDAVLLGRKPHMHWSYSPRDLQIVEEVLTAMGIGHLALRPLISLSGGEAQKVMIARALAQEPEVLLLDEPTSSLDLRSQLDVMNLLIETVRNRRISLVVAMHDLAMALRFADLFLFLKHGSVHAAVSRAGITAEMIASVYGVRVLLGEMDGYPFVIPIEEDLKETKER